MYPATIISWDDQSQIKTPEITTVRTMPLYAAVITSDKGTEEWIRLSGQSWFDMYTVGNSVDFSRHGQPLLQAANSIRSGAEMLCKRIVAPDAALANLGLVATVKTVESQQKVDENGKPLYWDRENDAPTTNPSITIPVDVGTENERMETIEWDPIMDDTPHTTITYKFLTAEGCKNKEEVCEALEAKMAEMEDEEGATSLLLFVFTDNGRGESKKRIHFAPNHTLSRNYPTFFMYDFAISEAGKQIGSCHFVLDPDLVYKDENMSLQYQLNSDTSQLKCYQYEENLRQFIDLTVGATGVSISEATGLDLMFGSTKKQKPIAGLTVDTVAGVDLQISTGQLIMNGSNGSWGNKPLEAADYADTAAMAFAGWDDHKGEILTYASGVYDPRIYDVDRYKIDAVLDANYPREVKHAIEQLVMFREDFLFFRDMGIGCNTLELIQDRDYDNAHNRFCMTYCTYYDIYDPFTRKQITVTITYSLARLLVTTFNNGRNLPIAGIKHGYIIDEAIKDTVGFTPSHCPGLNQKEELDTMRINYANYINDELVVETLYTSQDEYTQCSFGNNVMAVQEVVRRIRIRCPAIRYSFIDGDDLAKYKSEVDEIIAPYRSNFKKLEMTYMEDPYYAENKIFYAVLAVQFRDFVQTEYFKVVTLGSQA